MMLRAATVPGCRCARRRRRSDEAARAGDGAKMMMRALATSLG
jgi:hypothetical protein